MNAADAAGRKNFDACTMSDPRRRSYGRRTVPASSHCDGDVARADLFDVTAVRERVDLIVVESDRWLAVDDGDRRGNRAPFTNNVLQTMRSLQVLGARQAVRDHG